MAREVAGVALTRFKDPIDYALNWYSIRTDNKVVFDVNEATKLELSPDKPNSARSATTVKHLGEVVGTLYVIAFAPFDATGAESESIRLQDIDTGIYPGEAKYVPRPKTGTHTEAHLPISSHEIDSPNAHTPFFMGQLDVLGFTDREPGVIRKIGEVGQARGRFGENKPAEPRATVGYMDLRGHWNNFGERFGDPHAIYNPQEQFVQICGFLAISDEVADQHLDALRRLKVDEPIPYDRRY